jgi:hypothetical protein
MNRRRFLLDAAAGLATGVLLPGRTLAAPQAELPAGAAASAVMAAPLTEGQLGVVVACLSENDCRP